MSHRSRIGIAILVAVSALFVAAPTEARFIPRLNQVKADKGEIYRHGCMAGHDEVRSGPCRFGDLRSRRKVVLFGDSHALQWGSGLIRLAKRKRWQVIALTRASCPASLVDTDPICDRWRRNSLRRIRRMRPRLVVVSSAANDEAYKVYVDGWKLSREESQPYLVDGMVDVLRKLRRWSRRTVAIDDPALTPFNVTMCLRAHSTRPGRCGFHPDRPRGWDYVRAAAMRVHRVPLIDPMPMLCRDDWCRAVERDHLVYRSQGHLSASFVRWKYRWLGRRLGVLPRP
ncbi:MAG: hypothetical protein J0H98_05915 [Solirubrobacterales bacterium]|nr:hypothetical protein [Solirubrobacterales bacterium]